MNTSTNAALAIRPAPRALVDLAYDPRAPLATIAWYCDERPDPRYPGLTLGKDVAIERVLPGQGRNAGYFVSGSCTTRGLGRAPWISRRYATEREARVAAEHFLAVAAAHEAAPDVAPTTCLCGAPSNGLGYCARYYVRGEHEAAAWIWPWLAR